MMQRVERWGCGSVIFVGSGGEAHPSEIPLNPTEHAEGARNHNLLFMDERERYQSIGVGNPVDCAARRRVLGMEFI